MKFPSRSFSLKAADNIKRIALFFLLFSQLSRGQISIAKGIVFLDANNNGRYDQGEKGIEGVKVSNEVDVVKTDPDGRYEIPLPSERTLFIC